ncbi:hypothetical protein G6F22_013967 [Rhizopus arrhizus]|nr:hypothetical protein G6F22_013967 [Rhizopus arrhizus]
MTATGLAPERWRYIPNGVHTDEGAPSASAEEQPSVKLARQWREAGRSVVVYAGALGRPNHVDSLVQAIAHLRAQGDDKVSAIIVGRGELQDALRTQIAERNLGDRVALFEQMPKQAVLALLAHASIGYISLRPEPLFRFGVSPNKLWDYMLARLPVLFALHAGNDPVQEARCGISVDPGEVGAIAEGLRTLAALSEPERAAMGERGLSAAGPAAGAMTMRIAVTGASGYIGLALLRYLDGQGHDIIAFTRHATPAGTTRAQWRIKADGQPVATDLLGCDAVVHLAGRAHTRLALQDGVDLSARWACTAAGRPIRSPKPRPSAAIRPTRGQRSRPNANLPPCCPRAAPA